MLVQFDHAKDEVSEVARLLPTRVPAESSGSPYADQRTRRDRNVDRAVLGASGAYAALVLLLSVAPVLGEGFDPTPGREFWVGLVIGTLSCAALKWRRRFPVQLGLATVLAAAVSPTAGIAVLVMLVTVAIHRRWPWAALVGGANLAMSVLQMVWSDQGVSSAEVLVLAVLAALVTAVPIGLGMRIRSRRLRMDALRERAERAEAEQSRAADAARQAERTRIAREMHDVLAHRISLVSMHAGALEYLPNASPEDVATAAGVIRENAHHALTDLRDVIGVLRGGEDDAIGSDGTSTSRPQPTLDAIDVLIEETRAAGVVVRTQMDLPEVPLPAMTSRTAYRVLQEGLTNARKHGRGGAVEVSVRGTPTAGLTLEVRNQFRPGTLGRTPHEDAVGPFGSSRAPSAGPNLIPGSGVGLIGLAERARLAGGRIEHGTVDDAFRLHVWLPWPDGGVR